MLAAMKGGDADGNYEKLNFLFWKSRDKRFVLQDRESGEKVEFPQNSSIMFHPSTFQTGWVKWANKVPDFVPDDVAGVDGPSPSEEHKRYFNVTVTVNGERRQFSGEGPTSMSMIADLMNTVIGMASMSLRDIEEGALTRIKDFTVNYEGVKEFESKAGPLGKPVFSGLAFADSPPQAPAEPAAEASIDSDEIPF